MSIPTISSPRARFLPGGRSEWLTDPKTNLLSGLVVALALIPEAISFSIIAGVDPKIGLYASFSIAIIISFSGGRPGMISAATGAMALVIVPLVEEYGVGYLFAATVLAGLLQVGFGYLGVGDLMRFIPRTVMTGFVNALAMSKRLLNNSFAVTMEEALDDEGLSQTVNFGTKDTIEAIKAFMEKRDPVFEGR